MAQKIIWKWFNICKPYHHNIGCLVVGYEEESCKLANQLASLCQLLLLNLTLGKYISLMYLIMLVSLAIDGNWMFRRAYFYLALPMKGADRIYKYYNWIVSHIFSLLIWITSGLLSWLKITKMQFRIMTSKYCFAWNNFNKLLTYFLQVKNKLRHVLLWGWCASKNKTVSERETYFHYVSFFKNHICFSFTISLQYK